MPCRITFQMVCRSFDVLTTDAKSLISAILSEAEDRPTLAQILSHPFLSPHASKQAHILAHNLVIPFASPLEKRLLDRFEKANIDTRTLIQQVGEGGSGSLIGLWELSVERARKLEEHRKRKKKRRKSQDIDIEIISDYRDDVVSTPQELTPLESHFTGREFSLPRPPVFADERPRSRASKGSRASRRERPPSSRSRSISPSKSHTYRRPASPRKHKGRESKGIFHTLRNLLSDWTRQGQKLTHKKSKAAIQPDGNGIPGKDFKVLLELKKSKSRESAPKEELKRNRKGNLPNISIQAPPNRHDERSPVSYIDTESPAPALDDDESDATAGGGPRVSRHHRPSYRRRSTSSSITSHRSRHRYSHSKTSSTSSAGSGSVSTPRHSKGSLKIVPATPPPHLLTHEGAKGAGTLWGDGIVIARRRRSPFRGPAVGFMSGGSGGKRKGQGKQGGKWPEGAIKEEDEEVLEEEDIIDEGDMDGDGEEIGRGSYDIAELHGAGRRGSDVDVDGQSTSASV